MDRLGGSLADSRWKAIHDRWEGGMDAQGIGKDYLVTCSARDALGYTGPRAFLLWPIAPLCLPVVRQRLLLVFPNR